MKVALACLFAALLADSSAIATTITTRLGAAERPEADVARDAGRKPAEVLAFLGLEQEMTVLDLLAAGGWYTEVLAIAVGPRGRVYAQNYPSVLELREGAVGKELAERLADDRLPNVRRLDVDLAEVGLEPGSIDLAFSALNLHDIHNGRGQEVTVGFLRAVYALLAPGGVLGIVDHDGDPANDNAALHRMPRADAIAAAKLAGFVIEAEGEMLRNADDDRTRNVFAEGLRGSTDRFVLRLRKPSD